MNNPGLDEIIASYVEFDPLLGAAGTHVIGMITLSDDAAGTILVQMTDEDTVAITAPGPNLGDPPVVIVPANPAIFDGVITGGAFNFTDPPPPPPPPPPLPTTNYQSAVLYRRDRL